MLKSGYQPIIYMIQTATRSIKLCLLFRIILLGARNRGRYTFIVMLLREILNRLEREIVGVAVNHRGGVGA